MMRKSDVVLLIGILLGALLLFAEPAAAQNVEFVVIDNQGNVCPDGMGVTERVVRCIRGVVLRAVDLLLLPFSVQLSHIVRLVATLAVVFYGFNMMVGRQQRIAVEGLILFIKLGFVIVFTWNFGGMFYAVVDIMDWLVQVVSSYIIYNMPLSCPLSFSLWQRVDCAMDKLIGGTLPQSELSQGILGLLFGSIFSGPTGFAMFLIGLSFVVTLILAVIQAVFIYLSAFIALALLIIVSPMVIPTILFRSTKAYFEKWLRLVMGAILQPVFLFAYISMLLAAFDVVLYSGPKSVYRTIAGIDAAQPNFRIGDYLAGNGSYVERSALPVGIILDTKQLSAALIQGGPNNPRLDQTGTWGAMEQYSNHLEREYQSMIGKNIGADVRLQAVDYQNLATINGCRGMLPANSQAFKTCYTNYIIKVTMSLLLAAIISYIFKLMLQFVPYLSNSISGELMSVPEQVKGFMDKGTQGFQSKVAGPKPENMPDPPKPQGIARPEPALNVPKK